MQKIDLSGEWCVNMTASSSINPPTCYPETIRLPGTTSFAGLGPENPARETGYLTDLHPFVGQAWYMRQFEAGEWQGMQVLLTLERTRLTTVYLDGQQIGEGKSLTIPHRFLLPDLQPGAHTLEICVDNAHYPTAGGHLTSPDTQSNWNGITGEISLLVARSIIYGIRVRPDPVQRTLYICADVHGQAAGVVTVSVPGCEQQCWSYRDNRIEGVYPLSDAVPLWDSFHPSVQTLTLSIGDEAYETTFGLRAIHTSGRRLLCNDREIFLRGKHDALLFPKTGYTPTSLEEWLRVLSTAKEYGVNHYRFHTCCPPDAAFAAADLMGIYMEPELPFWGTVADKGEEKYDEKERSFLIDEGFSILREYGHHPSFIMLSMGNELWGSKAALNRMLADYRAFDPDKLYVSGSNNFQFVPEVLAEEDVFVGVRFSRDRLIRGSYAMCDAPQGIVQVSEPESVANYDSMIVPSTLSAEQTGGKVLIQYGTGVKEVDAESADALIPEVPVISHEVGQYSFYPDFSEIERYTGPLKPRNFEVFRERLIAAGLYGAHERNFRAAGRLAIDCYRREIETALRSRELSGFQLLDIQDYTGQGTALVGVLNAMMESKGLITPEGWRSFCADTVVLGLFERFIFTSGENVRFGIMISECDPDKSHHTIRCTLMDDRQVLQEIVCKPGPRQGRLYDAVQASFAPVSVDRPTKLTVRLELEDGTANEYPIWLFAEIQVKITREGIFTENDALRFVPDLETARKTAGKVIVVPSGEGRLPAEYCSDFWCYPMFRSISEWMKKPLPVGTLGLCIDEHHALLAGFPAEEYTTPPWYRLLKHAHCEPITQPGIVEMIDNVERCQRLGVLYVQEEYVHLTSRLWEEPDAPEIRAFAQSLLNGMRYI